MIKKAEKRKYGGIMIKKVEKRKYIVFSLFVAAILSLSVALPFLLNNTATAEENVEWNGIAIQDNYFLGHELTLPQASVTVGSDTVAAKAYTYFPDGRTYSATTLKLDTAGAYTVEFKANVGTKQRTTTRTFLVYSNTYTLSGNASRVNDSSVYYGKYSSDTEVDGLVFSLKSNVSIRFNKTIDLSGMTNEDKLFDMFIFPEVDLQVDFKLLTFVFTDVYDSSVTLTITLRTSASGIAHPCSYVMTAGNGQVLAGYESSRDVVHSGNQWGTPYLTSFAGNYGSNGWGVVGDKLEDRTFSPRFNYSTKEVFATESQIVADLDSPDYYSNLWAGFTTGEVKLEIFTDQITKNAANFVITEIAGYTVAELSTNVLTDTTPPVITVLDDGIAMPQAKTGVEYAVFGATAKDNYAGVCSVNKRVFFNYDNESMRIELPILDGSFTPLFDGEYVIEYTAADYWGNESKALRRVTSKATAEKLSISVNTATAVKDGVLGQKIKLQEAAAFGGNGRNIITVDVKTFGGSVAVENGYFRPLKTGTYSVLYTVTDYIGQFDMVSYTVTVTEGDGPIFENAPNFEKYYIKGYAYTLPAHEVYDYRSGTAVQLSDYDVSIKEGSSTVAVGADRKYTFLSASAINEIKVIYSSQGTSAEYTVNVVDVKKASGALAIDQYFVSSSGVTATANDSNISLSANTSGEVEFIKEQLPQNFILRFLANPSKNTFSSLEMVFTDSKDENQAITLKYEKSGVRTKITIGGITVEHTSGFNVASSSKEFEIKIIDNFFWLSGTQRVKPAYTDLGAAFSGFSSNKVHLSVRFNGVTGNGASIDIANLCGQTMINIEVDLGRPQIYISGDYGGVKALGEIITLPTAEAVDVLDPVVAFTVSVTDINGNYMADIYGNVLKEVSPKDIHYISFSEYGNYSVTYTAADSNNGRAETFSYNIMVYDSVPPTLTFKSDIKASVKNGDTVMLPKYEVSDNLSLAADITVSRYLYAPNGQVFKFTADSNSFLANMTGVYKILYTVADANGNAADYWLYVTAA